MSKIDRHPEPRSMSLSGKAQGTSSASGELSISSNALTYAEAAPGQWDVQRARHELKAAATQKQLQIDADESKHRRDQEAKDNTQRRNITYAVIALVISAYVFTALMATLSDNPDTRSQAWDILDILIGALAGAIAGYLAGSSKK